MGRTSLVELRRNEILLAYLRTLARLGEDSVSVADIAARAGFSPGMVHHCFRSVDALEMAALGHLIERFRAGRGAERENGARELRGLSTYALGRGPRADQTIARAWVALVGIALRKPKLYRRLQDFLNIEIDELQRVDGGLNTADATAVLSFVVGAFVVGAFLPNKARGFAAPRLELFAHALARAKL